MPSESSQNQALGAQTEQAEEQRHLRTQGDPGAEIARLKRRLAASQEEVRELTQGKVKKPP